jgi:hypothetical protein
MVLYDKINYRLRKNIKMKKYLSIIVLLGLFLIGCSEQMSVNTPISTNTNEPNWIALPKADGMQINNVSYTSKNIVGEKGGIIPLNFRYKGGPFGAVVIKSSLVFPEQSFLGEQTFTVDINDEKCLAQFGPHFIFNTKLSFNISFSGVDLSGVKPSALKFAYLAEDGSVQYAENDGVTVDYSTGTIEVTNAKIPHFSRYGFIN